MQVFGARALTSGMAAVAVVLVCAGPSFAGEPEQPQGNPAVSATAAPEKFLHQFIGDSAVANTGSYRPECWGEGQTPCSG
ncbi:hypothetical protein BJY24_005550 [Nocardia transvalensis]|uniref:Uncharacterized protein n=1 Tax=Nocardia transvalensis TaxID=37333 RepID=A0A7W9UKK0_9NOCA|nr:hypothetical protein [Nocardia transvalensis]MBB5916638.1 hypothetical protein [Nocardia transvalensis]